MKRAILCVFGVSEEVSDFGFFDIGTGKDYFVTAKNKKATGLTSLLSALEKGEHAKATIFLSGRVLEGLDAKMISRIRAMLDARRLELLSGPYFESLSCILSYGLFQEEVRMHQKKIEDVFQVKPGGFLNTASIFADDLAAGAERLGFDYAVVPRVPWFQFSGEEGAAFTSEGTQLKLLLIGTASDKSMEVHHEQAANAQTFARHHSYLTCAEMMALKTPAKKYRLPSVVARDVDSSDFSSLVGNSLQVQVFRRLKHLAESLTMRKELSNSVKETAFRLANVNHFRALRTENQERHNYYLNLMNCLADFELELKL